MICPKCRRPLEQLFEIAAWACGEPTPVWRCKDCKIPGETARFIQIDGTLVLENDAARSHR